MFVMVMGKNRMLPKMDSECIDFSYADFRLKADLSIHQSRIKSAGNGDADETGVLHREKAQV